MVKPGIYTVNKKQLNDGEKTTEYVHVEVQPLPAKSDTVVRDKKGRCCMKVLGIVLFLCVLVGIAVGITYATRWDEESHHGEWPEGGDVIYPSEGYPWDQDRPNDHDGHHGDHPDHHGGHPDGPHEGHHGDYPGDHHGHPDENHDGHHGDHPHHHPEDGDHHRPVSTERPPPIDYIGTPPPLIGQPGDGHDEHGHGNDDDNDGHGDDGQHDGRPDHGDDGQHDGRPDHGDDGQHEGRPDHGDDGQHNDRPGHEWPGQDHDDDGYHRNIVHPPFTGMSQWQARRAQQQQAMTRARSQTNRFANKGRSRVEIEEARHGGDYGHGRRMNAKSRKLA